MATPVRELDPRPDHQVLHRLGNHDSSLGRSSHHSGGDVDGDAPHAPIQHLDLPGVKAGSDLDPQRSDGIGSSVAHRTARAGPSKVARKPSPIVWTSCPRKRSSFALPPGKDALDVPVVLRLHLGSRTDTRPG
jgi:hypothetical protein